MPPNHTTISPGCLYWGTPVVLITTKNPNGTTNIAPMSSAWFLGRSCVLGLASASQTPRNLLRTGECVLNLPDDGMAAQVNALARTTGADPMGAFKARNGYEVVGDKWARSGLSRQEAELVGPARVAECPVQMECRLLQSVGLRPDQREPREAGGGVEGGPPGLYALEVHVLRVHVREDLRLGGYANRVDPDRWRPLIMSFQHYYGLREGKLEDSVLARISEEQYRDQRDEYAQVGTTPSGEKSGADELDVALSQG